ncbi:DUF1735 and LamG domain-containing protein [Bacteroides sp.]|uniref:DUF1735 and LamG domain-containing protein n=1 Tax=Bacteroides sp. TaxID=29523 RepID=UPI0025BB60DD|nr:DUF1735 and LamG domain-containing protein [Bacteroides sp.]
MKKNKIYTLFAGAFTLIALIGCKQDYEPIENRIYINEAASKNVKSVAINVGEKTITDFTVRMADIMGKDVQATLAIDESLLQEYNKKMNLDYAILPADKYSFEKEVVIESGKTMAKPTVITINPYEAAEGVKYALPIRVISDGSVQEEIQGAKYILLLDKPWSQFTPYLNRTGGFKSENVTTLSMDYFTIEFWLWMDSFDYNNQCVIDCPAFYIRLGNANNQITKDQMQINIFGTGGENNKGFFNKFTLQKKTWTHIAMVYDQSKCHFYANGEKVQDVEATGVPVPITSITFFNANTLNDHMMGQVRLWNRVLTQAEIQSNMGGPVAVSSNLVGYWKMDEGQGDVAYDSSGNKNDATIVTGAITQWKADQCFTKKN